MEYKLSQINTFCYCIFTGEHVTYNVVQGTSLYTTHRHTPLTPVSFMLISRSLLTVPNPLVDDPNGTSSAPDNQLKITNELIALTYEDIMVLRQLQSSYRCHFSIVDHYWSG